MKFQKLTIHNMASIEDAEIDFEHGPLAEDTRFLICGPTGAGKTTILDCICLALYGTTPRLNLKKVESYVDQYENFKLKNREDIKIDDTRMLMRRGSVDAFVEIIFTDKDDVSLKAVWQCSRAHGKLHGNIKEPEWLLFDAATDTLLDDRKSVVLEQISSRIGLTFDQFCRTTMLAQGDFTKFLKSEEGEKSQILEKLTGTDIYSEISVRIHQVKTEKETICSQIASKMEGVHLLSDDELQAIHDQISVLDNKLKILSEEEKSLNNKLQWKSQLEDFIKQLDEVNSHLKQQTEKEESAEFKSEEHLLKDWNDTQEQREQWKKRSLAKQDIDARKIELEKKQQVYGRLCAGFMGLQQTLEKKYAIQKRIEEYLSQEKPKETCYKQISLIEMLVAQQHLTDRKIADSTTQIGEQDKELIKLEQRLAVENKSVKDYDHLRQEKLLQLTTASRQLESLNYTSLLSEQKSAERERTDLKDFQLLVENSLRLTEEHDQKAKALNEIQSNVSHYEKEVAQAEKVAQDIDERIVQQTEVYEKQVRACSDVMKEYRSLLKEGDTCPLCGQKISRLENDQHFASILQPIKELLVRLQKDAKDANKRLSDVKAQLVLYRKELPKKQKELESVTGQLNETNDKLRGHVLYGTYELNDSTLKAVDDALLVVTKRLATITEKLAEVGKQQNLLTQLQKEKEKLETVIHTTELKVQELVRKQTVAKERKTSEQNMLHKLRQERDEAQSKLAQYIELETYQIQGDAYIQTLKEGANNYQVANEKAVSVANNIQLITNELKLVEQIKENIDAQQTEWQHMGLPAPIVIEKLSDAWVELQTQVSRVSEALNLSEQQYKVCDDALNEYLAGNVVIDKERIAYLASRPLQEIESLRVKHQETHEQHVKLAALKESCEKKLVTHRENAPILDDDVTLEMLKQSADLKANEIKEQNQLLGKFTQSLESDKQNRARYASIGKELEKARAESEKWTHLHKLFGSNDGKKFRNIAQSYVLEQLLVNANQYLCQFTTRYEMECQPGSLTILLRDKEAGGVVRPTTTISGGESFLISLSLALGLSTLSRSSLSMDTLFIDEGFGTLDSTYLSSVMDTLERLHQIGGKRIGIISHVESLKERITTQIQVTRVNNTLSKINVVSLV